MRIKGIGVGLVMVLCVSVLGAQARAQEPPAIFGPNGNAKITLDIKGMDVVDVMKMLATRAGLNIVIGKNVMGKVTLFLKDVGIADAFELIISSNDLAYDTQGTIINVMTQRDYELLYGERYQDKKRAATIQLKYAKAADLARALNQIKTNIGRIVTDDASNTVVLIDAPDTVTEMAEFIKKADLPVQTRIFSLNYAQAEKVGPKLQDVITKNVGVLKVDERTNKIAITDYPDKLVEIDRIVSAFDEKPRQVLIDAQIIEVNPSDKFEMGVDWDYWLKKHFRIAASLPIGTDNRLIFGTPVDNAITNVGDNREILDILRTIGDTKILSSPRIMAINNQEAKILVGTKEAYITSSTSQTTDTAITSQTVNFVDVGIKLYVTPTISTEGFVTMKIKPEVSSAETVSIVSANQKTDVPIVTTSETETAVVVKDGVTIIIGGLQKDDREKTVKKIPLLGDVPFLGHLFRSNTDNMTKSELVILLTPHIMSGEHSFTDVNAAKPTDGAIVRMVDGKMVTEHIDAKANRARTDAYYNLILDKARSAAFTQRPKGQKGLVKIAFTLSANGSLLGEPRIIQGDNDALNTFAAKAVKRAAPFPAFPGHLNRSEETFKIDLSYE